MKIIFESKQNNRIKILISIFLLIFILILVRIFYVQVIEYKKINTLANDLWTRELPVKAERGKILDRNGKVIVDNITTSSLIVVPSQIKDKEYASNKISEILNVSYDEIYSHLNKKVSIERIHPEGRNLNSEISNKINELNIDGVYLLKESKRSYPYNEMLSHVLGYTGIDNQGLSGIELKYESFLKGTDGSIKYYSDGKGNKLELSESYNEPINGNDITLTIDLDIQLSLENELDIAMNKYKSEGAIGIVMNPNTGEILAMSSKPSFNINNYQNYSAEIINRNLAIWQNFEPGSTFKIVTLAAAINEGKVNIFEDMFYDSGSIKVEGATLHCWKRKGHGSETFLQVVENSCNPGFVVLGQKLGKDKLFEYITALGFGKKTGIDLNGEATGILFNLDKVGPVELATTAFGQGVSVTAIQQVSSLSAVINGGTYYTPYIVSKYKDKNTTPTIQRENIITKETSDLVKYALESVVANGSGRNAYIDGYRVGGKTGTAQKVGSNGTYMDGNYILSFIGFMNADNPEYVIYIALDNPKGVTQYGGVVAAPIAKNVLKQIINVKQIPKSENGLPMTYRWDDIKYVTVPEVIGMSKKKATSTLKKLGLNVEYSGSGDNVIDVSVSKGNRVKENTTIKLLLK